MATRKRSAPAKTGVITRARVALLGEVWRGRVRWVVPSGPALLTPRQTRGMVELVDVTRTFMDLARSGWSSVAPWDDKHPPAAVECQITAAGERVLMQSQMKARRKQVGDQAKRRKTRQAAARRSGIAALIEAGRALFRGRS